MINGCSNLNRNINAFQSAITELSFKINNAGINWRDEKFRELSHNISIMALNTQNVLHACTHYERAISEFERISMEEY
jgi:hypothetical protein